MDIAGDLVFVADGARRFQAFDADTGDILWGQILNSSAGGFPVSYMVAFQAWLKRYANRIPID